MIPWLLFIEFSVIAGLQVYGYLFMLQYFFIQTTGETHDFWKHLVEFYGVLVFNVVHYICMDFFVVFFLPVAGVVHDSVYIGSGFIFRE